MSATDSLPTSLTIPTASGGSFNSAFALRQSIAKAVAEVIPEGRTGAAVGILDTNGLHIVLASRIGDDWTVSGTLTAQDGKHVSGEVRVMGSW